MLDQRAKAPQVNSPINMSRNQSRGMTQSFNDHTITSHLTRDAESRGVDQQSLMNLSQRHAGLNASQTTTDRTHRKDKSPNTARLQALKLQMQLQGSQKYNSVQVPDSDSDCFESIPDRAKYLNDQLDQAEQDQETKIKVLADSIDKINSQAQTQIGSDTIMHDMKSNELKQAETKLQFELSAESQNCKETEQRINKAIDEKLYNLRLELAKEKKAREESQEQYQESYGAQLRSLTDAISEEGKDREESQQQLVGILSDEVSKFHAQLQQERQEREQAQELLSKMIEEMAIRVQDMLAEEVKQREETEERLIGLLEDTCARVEKSI